MHAFDLSKWYLDCTTEDGDFALLYYAELRVGSIPIHYESLLCSTAGSDTNALFSLRGRSAAPVIENGHIFWKAPKWKAEACWSALGAPHRELLFRLGAGTLDWHCVAPRATTSMQVGPSVFLKGYGYAEHLHLSLPPWRLPIRRLRWGRFVNATDSLVWIDWTGDYEKRVVYVNGSPACATVIGDTEIVLSAPRARLSFTDSRVIRDGKLGSTALAVIPRLGSLFPSSVLNIHERKLFSRATLQRPGQPDSVGFAIHEVVEWP